MNSPARFDSLIWMASPMLAWAQAGTDAPSSKPREAKSTLPVPRATRTRRKRKKIA